MTVTIGATAATACTSTQERDDLLCLPGATR